MIKEMPRYLRAIIEREEGQQLQRIVRYNPVFEGDTGQFTRTYVVDWAKNRIM